MAWKDVTITDAGEKILEEMVNGSKLILTRAAIGAGTVPVEELPSLTDVIEPITAPALLAGEEPTEGGKIIKIQVRNDGVAETTRMRQIAIYAKTDHEDEVLFVILQDEIGEEIPAYDEFPQFDIEQWVTLALSRTNNITVTVNPLAFVPAVEFEKEVKRLDTAKANKSDIINPNLLINPDFRINQRGQSSYGSGGQYTADRWYKNSAGTISVDDGKIIFSGDGSLIRQVVENEELLIGREMTVSVSVNGKIREGTFIYPDKSESSISLYYDADIGFSRYLDSGGFSWIVFTPLTEGVEMEWAKLEFGDKATRFIPPEPVSELMKCQKYYQLRSTGNVPDADLRPPMRITPTVKAKGDVYSYDAEIIP
ncbi:MAG: hypothetical protein J1F04_01485 [Oscillospiraceae bacterium]|nr:hypothetical protein [Oscillospiraceae bacterium]